MNFKLTLTLVIVLLLLTSLFVALRNRQPVAKAPQNVTTPLFEPKLTGLKALSYARDGKQQIALAREGDKWNLTFPVAAPADTSVGWTAEDLKALAYKEKFEPSASGVHSADSTGTQNPRNIIQITDDAGKEYTLALGKRAVGGIFATLNGAKTIYLLSSNPLDELDKDPQDFRDKNIKNIPPDKVSAITLTHGNITVSLVKSAGADRNWLINAPVSARAKKAAVDDILSQLKTITAATFSDMTKDMPATGLNPPVVSVTALVNESAPPSASAPVISPPILTPVTLELGYYTDLTNKKNVYASLAGSKDVFTLSAEAFKKLNCELRDLRDPAVTPAAADQATNAKITSTDKQHTLEVGRVDGQWKITSFTTPVKAGDLEVGDLLGDISHLRAINYEDNAGNLKSLGLDPPQTIIDLTIPHQSQHEVLLVGTPETAEKVTPIMRQGEPTVYLVQSADADKILPTTLSLRDKAIERLSSDRIRGITIAGPAAGNSTATLEREGTTWKVKTAGKSQSANDENITSLLADFTPLTAAKYLSDSAIVSNSPDVTVTVDILEIPTNPATTSPTTTSAPAPLGPEMGHMITRILKLYRSTKDNQATWQAIWDGPSPQWTFEPTPELITHVTRETYAVPSTQPATQPATTPAK